MADHKARIPLKKRLLTAGALATSALLMGLGVTQVVAATATAAGSAFSCDENTVYAINSSGAFESIKANSGAATVLTSQSPSNNALGITQGGALSYSTLNTTSANASGTIVAYNPVTDKATDYPAYVPANTYRGAVDPKSGVYYYAQGNTTSAAVYGFDTTTNTSIGQVGVLTLNQASTGDFAFSTTGVLYVVSGNEVDRVNGTLPTSTAANPTASFSVTKIAQLGSVTASPGIAFSTSGFLYVAVNGTLQEINPTTGATVATQTITDGSGKTFTPTDLASCNYADSITAQASVDQRWKSTDQFTLTINGPSYGNTATTSGSATGLQAATAGSNLVVAGSPYTVTQTAATGSGTDLSDYSTTWECKSATGSYDQTGTGDTATVNPPTDSDNDIACVFTNKLVAVHVSGADDTYYTPTNTQLNQAAPGVLANDAQATGLSITSHTQPSHGTLDSFNSTGTSAGAFSYTPTTSFAGVDSFTYTTQDSSGQSQTNTVTINVGPLAQPDSGTVVVGGTLNVDQAHGVLSNDSGTNLTASNASTPSHGTVSLQSNGAYTYTSTDSYSGTDTWTYVVTDGGGHTQTGTVTETITPKAVADTLLDTAADTAESVTSDSLLSNDVGTSVTVKSVSASTSQGGTVALSSDGKTVTYTPAADFSGVDTFTYTIVDKTGGTGTATETVTVDPVAKADAIAALQQGQSADIDPSTLLANDRGSNLSITGVSNASRGTVSIDQSTGHVIFTPTPGTSGNASFSYTISDGTNTSTATVAVPVYPAPGDHTTTATSGKADVVDADNGVLSGASGSDLRASNPSTPHHGTVTLNDDGSYTYTPDATYSGPDAFTYTVTDGSQDTTTGKVTITVLPLAVADTIPDTTAGTAETVKPTALTGNDNGAHLSISSVGTVAGGNAVGGDATLNGDGTVTFTPADGFSGPASFEYTVTDGTNSSTANVTFDVTPKAVADSLPDMTSGTSKTFDKETFLGNDLGTDLHIVSVSGASLGDVVLDPSTQAITYTAQSGFSGTYTFSYTVEDSSGQTDTADVTVVVAPTAGSLAITATAGTTDSVSAAHGLLSTDSGAAGSDLKVALDTDPGHTASHGTVTLGTGGAFTYTPDAGYSGPDSFDYTVTDSNGTTSTGTVTVTVDPSAAPFTVQTAAGADLKLAPATILGHADGTSLQLTVDDPAKGAITTDTDGNYVYSPKSGFSGTDTFTYTVTDPATGHSATATISVTVKPVANDDKGVTTTGTTLTVATAHGVLSNDLGSTLSASVKTQPADGKLTLNADGSYTYVPKAGFSGTDSFTYTLTDGSHQTTTATVTIEVDPAVQTVTAAGLAGSPAHLDAPGVLSGDSGTGLHVTGVNGSGAPGAQVTTPAGNTVTIGSDGTFTFTPAPGYSGVDTIPVTVTDGNGLSSTGQVVVTVKPKAVNDSYSTPANTPTPIAVTGPTGLLTNDLGTGLTVTSVTGPAVAHGTLVKQSGGSYVYTPNAGFSGTDSFGYTVTDASGLTATAIATIIVGDQAANYTATVPAGSPYGVTAQNGLLKNDSGTGLTPTLDQAPQHGTVKINPDGSYTYTPAKGFSGTDSFTYRVTDSSGQVSTGQVNMTVTPTATNDSEKIGSGSTLTLKSPGVLSNDNGTALLVTAVGTPSKGGTATISGAGKLVYTPKPGFSGTETIPYTITDQDGQTAQATVTVDVTPVATGDTRQTIAGHAVTVSAANGLLANDSGSGLTAALKTAPKHGTVTVNPDGSYTYTPDKGFAGQDSFVYTATDSSGQVTTATATINVLASATAKSVTVHGKPGQKITIAPLNSDTPTAGANFDPSTLQLIDPSSGTAVNAFTIPGKGTFAVVDGQVTFTPVAKFTGSASIGYRVSDSADQLVSATITVVIPKPGTPAAAGSDPTPAAASGGAAPKPGSLAFTGSRGVSGMLMIGFGGILLGFVLVLMRRFRREAPGPRRTGM